MRTFQRYSAYRRHVTHQHKSLLEEDAEETSHEPQASLHGEPETSSPGPSDQVDHEQDPETDCGVLTRDSVKEFALLILKWKEGRRIPDSTVNEIVNDIMLYIQGLLEQGCASDIQERLTSVVEQSMEQLSTKNGRESYWKLFLPFVEPRTIVLGQTENGATNVCHYVPICEVLKHLLQSPGMAEQLRPSTSHNGYLTSVFDGTAFHDHAYFRGDKSKLCIQLYSNEFEVCDPLGSKRELHKLMAVYFSILNLPQKSRSSLLSIHLALLVRDKHVSTYGLNSILRPLLEDVVRLETEGIEVEGHPIKGTVFVVTGDNLSQHRLGGFKCSFSHGRICRFCLALRHEISIKHIEQEFVLRTPSGHQHHLTMHNAGAPTVSLYGVREPCELTFSGFDPTQHLPPDVMHDIHEGVLPFAIKHILSNLISLNFFSIDDLNKEIIHFGYSTYDNRNKPQPVSREFIHGTGSMKGNASQFFCFFRHLSLYVGDRVPSDCPAWKVYTLLRQVVDLIMCRRIPVSCVPYLQRLIYFFLMDFHSLFPSVATPPKMHYLIHYPSYIYRYGPLINLWAMRFEAKHQYFKDIARKIRNFRNITFSLATRHQYLQMYLFSQSHCEAKLTTTGSRPCILEHVPDVLKNFLCAENISSDNIIVVKSITVDGAVYSSGSVLVRHISDDELPVFLQLCDIYTVNRLVLGVAQVLETLEFDRHFHVYVVQSTSQHTVVRDLQNIESEQLFLHRQGKACDKCSSCTALGRCANVYT
ncbi:uncharacterized protein LOC135389426 [Ornithodoros turicata]|uniref:uncharacterized protein LOC135389426 n=1 Tax=Ornithodoros turicata TaxID=34597 RepID=UPI003138A5E1